MTNDSNFDSIITPLANVAGVPVPLVKGIIAQESGFDPTATNLTGPDGARGGAFGLMQVTMTTALGMGFSGSESDLLDPTTNLTLGIRFLGYAFQQAGGDWGYAAAIYNGGKRLGDGSYTDQAYVTAVIQYAESYGGTPVNAAGAALAPSGVAADSAAGESAAADSSAASDEFVGAIVGALIIGGLFAWLS